MEPRLLLLSLAALRVDSKSIDWSLLAREATRDPSLSCVLEGRFSEQSRDAARSIPVLQQGLDELDQARAKVDDELAAADAVDARLITVLDDDYPQPLREVPDRPPFLFVKGDLSPVDDRAVAVVGTRAASELGLRRASQMSALLVERDVTVVSGLAKGIDTAAHTAALDTGGRTIAVYGTGITKVYPAENRSLATRIIESGQGAVVSQFWPTAGGARWTFPRRNRTTSGLSQGTVVIEASSTSGAKMQARVALEQGKRVWLLSSLTTEQEWARKYVANRGAVEVSSVDDVVGDLDDRDTAVADRGDQLTLDAL